MHDYPYEQRVLPYVLADKAAKMGDAPLVTGDAELTYREARDRAAALAGGLRKRGVQAGDRVLAMLPNTTEAVIAFLGIAWAGAVSVPVNTGYRGEMLRYLMDDAEATVLVIDAEYVPIFLEVAPGLPGLREVVLVGQADLPDHVVTTWDVALASEGVDPANVTPGDLQAIMYTSGTTGPSKGVMVPYHLAYQYANPNASHFQVEGEVIYVTLPLFHIGGQWQGVYAALQCEGTAVLKRKFSVSTFWEDVDRFGVTQTTLLGVMAEFLWKQPQSPADPNHSLQRVTMAPALKEAAEFAKRFGVRLGQGWGLTEIGAATRPPALDEPMQDPMCCGRVRDDMYEMVLVDDDDLPVPTGTAGQALVRPREPFAMMLGYWRKPEATVAAWRNLWFHTGDALVENADGTYTFVDRQKDCIRRRGENISSLEVERGVLAHPSVGECAAVPVQTDHLEDEVMVIVSPKPGASLDPDELHEFLAGTMPRFMVPRYIEVLEDLPKTPTSKIKKDVLRKVGVSPTTWDATSTGGAR